MGFHRADLVNPTVLGWRVYLVRAGPVNINSILSVSKSKLKTICLGVHAWARYGSSGTPQLVHPHSHHGTASRSDGWQNLDIFRDRNLPLWYI